jgi:type IV pilus biogenesis protein CpaD/CtpE
MLNSFPTRACLLMLLLAIPGCAQLPPDYSPNYSYMSEAPLGPTGRTQRHVLVPNACLTADPTDTAARLGPHLPPGCANAHDLLTMVEHDRDLVEGRPLGPAPAAPSARAAQKYIDGVEAPLGAGVSNRPNVGTPPPVDTWSGTQPSTQPGTQQVSQ